jgi:hypothetical protein
VKELKKFLLGFFLAAVCVSGAYFAFVHQCNLITKDPTQESRCKCMGKVVNLKYLLGSGDAFDLPKKETCIGVVTKRM